MSSPLRLIATDAEVARGRVKTEAKGLRVVDYEGYAPTTYAELAGNGGPDVDTEAHARSRARPGWSSPATAASRVW